MARYIDVESFIKWLEETIHQPISHGITMALNKVLVMIKSIPTADVVEVVRCENCKHSNDDGTICRYSVGRAVEPEHFCGYGTPKERGENK